MKTLYILLCCFCVGVTLAQSDIASLEYFFDEDPGIGLATNINIDPDAETINQSFSISTATLTEGTHRLFIRAINSNGDISLYEHKTFRIAPITETNTSDIVEAEYFFNQDPGIGLATALDLTDAETIDETLPVSTSGLPVGTHRLFVRVKNSNNEWSLYEHKIFKVNPITETNTSDIVEAEYFFNQDPGIGLATALDLTDAETIDETLPVSTSGLPVGTHRLFVRVKNSNNEWSLYEHKTFKVNPITETNTNDIVAAEYFIDVDPGLGNGMAISITGDIIDEDFSITTSGSLAQGDHYLHIRVLNSNGEWSLYERQPFEVDGTLGINSVDISEIRCFPNPTSENLNITLPDHIQIQKLKLYDITGKQVIEIDKHVESLAMSSLKNGIYLLILDTNKGQLSKRIIKN